MVPIWRLLVFGQHPNRTLCRLIFLIIFSLVLFKFLLVPIQIVGTSMFPTYQDGAVNFVNKWSYLRSSPRRGDVIAIRSSGDQERRIQTVSARNRPDEFPPLLYLKRIVGLPGEQVALVNGLIEIDGQPLNEPYAIDLVPFQRTMQLGPHEYFVIGDNRAVTILGTIPDSDIVGKVMF
jgi:signal peptidase I